MKCDKCHGRGEKFVVDRVVQGQDYGPEVEGHDEICLECDGSGQVPPLQVEEKEAPG